MKTALLALTGVLLASCGTYQFAPATSFTVSASTLNAGVSITATTVTNSNGATTTSFTPTYTPATITFQAAPGSMGGQITSVSVTHDVVTGTPSGGTAIDETLPDTTMSVAAFVPAGETCNNPLPGPICPLTDSSTTPALGSPVQVQLNLIGQQAVTLSEQNPGSSFTQTMDLTFSGVDTKGQSFSVSASNVSVSAYTQ